MANMVQNVSLAFNMTTVVVNIMINALEVKQINDQGPEFPGIGEKSE